MGLTDVGTLSRAVDAVMQTAAQKPAEAVAAIEAVAELQVSLLPQQKGRETAVVYIQAGCACRSCTVVRQVTTQLLLDSQAGKQIRKLAKHSNADVARAAGQLVDTWKEVIRTESAGITSLQRRTGAARPKPLCIGSTSAVLCPHRHPFPERHRSGGTRSFLLRQLGHKAERGRAYSSRQAAEGTTTSSSRGAPSTAGERS